MKLYIVILLAFLSISSFASFDNWFYHKTLRVDYYHSGDFQSEYYSLDEAKTEPYWGGSDINLIDTFYYGQYYFKVFDKETDSLIYSRGYGTLFGEWQTTEEAKITNRSFTETIVCPLPRKDAQIVFYSRNKNGEFEKKFEYNYQTSNYFVSPERNLTFASFDAYISGPSEKCVDIVVIPEGYTQEEMGKFISDCQNFANVLFSFEPYSRYKNKFNIRGVLSPSKETGSDIPADSVWAKTIMNTSFYTFDSERYCMTFDNKSVRDLAANAPYDQIYILLIQKNTVEVLFTTIIR